MPLTLAIWKKEESEQGFLACESGYPRMIQLKEVEKEEILKESRRNQGRPQYQSRLLIGRGP